MKPCETRLKCWIYLAFVKLTNPAGATYNYQTPQDAVVGGLNPWAFGITLLDLTRGTELLISGAEPPIGAMTGLIHEKPFSGGDLWYETGRWTDAYVPEPSLGSLACAAGAAWPLRKLRGRIC